MTKPEGKPEPVVINLDPGPPDWEHIMALTQARMLKEASEPTQRVMSYEHFLIETGQHPLFRK